MCQWVSGGFPGSFSFFLQIRASEIAPLALSCFAQDMRFRAPMCSEVERNTGFQLYSSIVSDSVGNTSLFITKMSLSPCWMLPKDRQCFYLSFISSLPKRSILDSCRTFANSGCSVVLQHPDLARHILSQVMVLSF